MTITLFDLVYRTLRELGEAYEGTATGGSTTTLIDTSFLAQADDWWGGTGENMGTAMVLYDAAGAGAAPQGEFARVTDFVQSTKTATITALTAAIAAGDRYAIANGRYPLAQVIQAINGALQKLGELTTSDTSLTTASNQSEYTLPAANMRLRRVWLQQNTSDADDNQWHELRDWYLAPTTTGAADTLILGEQVALRSLRLEYTGPHPALYTAAGKLSEDVPPTLVVYQAALDLILMDIQRQAKADPRLETRAGILREGLRNAESLYSIQKPRRKARPFFAGTLASGDDFKAIPTP